MKLKSILCLFVLAGFCSSASAVDDKKALKDLKTTEQKSKEATKERTQEGAKATSGKGVDTKGTYKEPVKVEKKESKSSAQISKEENAKQQVRDRDKAKEINEKNQKGAPPKLH